MEDFLMENKWEFAAFGTYVILVLLFRVYMKFIAEPRDLKNKNR